MKKIWSKNTVIVLLALTSLSAVAYIVSDKVKGPPAPRAQEPPRAKRGIVVPANSFKDDSELQACYEALLAREPNVQEGTVQLQMTINDSGAVDYLEMVHTDLEDAEFTGCILDKVRQKRLPATADRIGVLISHKFNFHKKDTGEVTFTQ